MYNYVIGFSRPITRLVHYIVGQAADQHIIQGITDVQHRFRLGSDQRQTVTGQFMSLYWRVTSFHREPVLTTGVIVD
jgi:hypothetical protein